MTARLDSGEFLRVIGFVGLASAFGLLAGMSPSLAISLAVACGFVAIAFTNFTVALAVFCYEPMGLGVDESLLARVALIVLVLAWMGVLIGNHRQRADFFSAYPGVGRLLILFVAWMVLSITWAESTETALDAVGQFVAALAIFVMTFTAARDRRQAFLVSAILVVGGVAAAGLALLTPGAEESGRLANTSTGSNELAAVLVVAFAVAVGLVLAAKRSSPQRFGALCASVFCLLGVFLTASRGALIALGAMMLVAIVFGGLWRGRIVIATVLVVFGTTFYFTALAPQSARERVEQTTEGQTRFMEGRTTIWTVAERMAKANLIKGVGAGNFKIAARHYLLQPGSVADSQEIIEQPKVAHNSYLEVLTGLGVIGLSMFLAIVLFALTSALRAARNFRRLGDHAGFALATAIAIGMVGVLTADFFLSQQAEKQVWMLLGLGPALLSISATATTQRDRSFLGSPTGH